MSRSALSRPCTPLGRGALIVIVLVIALGSPASAADKERYFLSLGDSLAVGVQPIGPPPTHETDEGYADQLHAGLLADNPRLTLVKLGCGGESTVSMRFGSQVRTVVSSCATPRGYKDRYPKGTQLAEAVAFLEAHKGKVALVTIDIGSERSAAPRCTGQRRRLPVRARRMCVRERADDHESGRDLGRAAGQPPDRPFRSSA